MIQRPADPRGRRHAIIIIIILLYHTVQYVQPGSGRRRARLFFSDGPRARADTFSTIKIVRNRISAGRLMTAARDGSELVVC